MALLEQHKLNAKQTWRVEAASLQYDMCNYKLLNIKRPMWVVWGVGFLKQQQNYLPSIGCTLQNINTIILFQCNPLRLKSNSVPKCIKLQLPKFYLFIIYLGLLCLWPAEKERGSRHENGFVYPGDSWDTQNYNTLQIKRGGNWNPKQPDKDLWGSRLTAFWTFKKTHLYQAKQCSLAIVIQPLFLQAVWKAISEY